MAFVHGGYVPRAIPLNTIRSYPAPGFGTSSNSAAVPATSTATSSVPPFHAEGAASSRHLGHVALGPGSSARSRRLRDAYHAFHPLIVEENNLRGSAAEVEVNFFLTNS